MALHCRYTSINALFPLSGMQQKVRLVSEVYQSLNLTTIAEFIKANPQYLPRDNAMSFISDDGGNTYNLCHCRSPIQQCQIPMLIMSIVWSNFEIGDLDFWRGEAYTKYFEHLDAQGGFYYERWGDAPVHSLGAALFARKDQIHYFHDIGYRHEPFQHCPQGNVHTLGKVSIAG